MKKSITTKLVARLYASMLFAVFIGFSSCSKKPSEEKPAIKKTDNILILNEGTFGAQDGTISSLSLESISLQNKLYKTANQAGIGGLINAGIVHDKRLYTVINSLDKVEITDTETFKHVASIKNQMKIPRQVVIAKNKLYVSNWGDYNDSWQNPNAYVLVFDLENNTLIKRIKLKNGVDHMLVVGADLYVAHKQEPKISIIDTKSDAVSSEIKLAASPRCMVADKQNNIWVITGSKDLSKIDTKSKSIISKVHFGIEQESIKGNYLASNPAGNTLYFMAGEKYPSKVTNLYKLDISASTPTPMKLISKNNMYSFGIDPADGTIYVGIAYDFKSNGTVVRFKPDGSELDSFTAGVAPKAFIFN